MKSAHIASTTGRRPAAAAPTPAPTKPASEIGVSRTRFGAEQREEALRGAERAAHRVLLLAAAPGTADDVLAHHDHRRVGLHRLPHRLADRVDHRQRALGRDGHQRGLRPCELLGIDVARRARRDPGTGSRGRTRRPAATAASISACIASSSASVACPPATRSSLAEPRERVPLARQRGARRRRGSGRGRPRSARRSGTS